MARNGSGVYSLPAGSIVANGETVVASQHNTPLEDLKDDANLVRPIVAGGTGGSTPETARAALGTVLQTSATDDTAGSVLLVGAGGLLGTGKSLGTGDDFDDVGDSQFFGVTNGAVTPANSPSPGSFFAGIHSRTASNQAMQLVGTTGGPNPFALRWRSQITGWSAWRTLFDTNNIIGPVSQSGGDPTGAVIEQGSNANGEYVRFADGTQICWNDGAAITTNPAAFVGTVTSIDSNKLRIGRWF